MAFVRKRTTAAGGLCTTLVEPYRDANGKPRQRIMANLYGCETPLEALAKLAAQRHRLRQERDQITELLAKTDDWATVAIDIAADPDKAQTLEPQERRDLHRLLQDRKKAQARLARIDSLLARVKKDGGAIRKHVTATEPEIQQAIKHYRDQLKEAETRARGAAFMAFGAQQEAAKLNLPGEAKNAADPRFFRAVKWQ